MIITFYDDFSKRLLADYVYGNPRGEAAIRHALQFIPSNAKRILDIVCGIGWSTHEIKRHFPWAFVLGVDISSKMVELARQLFSREGLEFIAHDALTWHPLFEPPYDAVVLLDVYEHIPKDRRNQFHQVLKRVLTTDSVLIQTFPSVFHQEFLRKFHSEELQPVDEDVTEKDITKVAQDVEGALIYWSYENIWQPKDYVHTVITRGQKLLIPKKRLIILENRATRQKGVSEQFESKSHKRRNNVKEPG